MLDTPFAGENLRWLMSPSQYPAALANPLLYYDIGEIAGFESFTEMHSVVMKTVYCVCGIHGLINKRKH